MLMTCDPPATIEGVGLTLVRNLGNGEAGEGHETMHFISINVWQRQGGLEGAVRLAQRMPTGEIQGE